MSDQQTTDYLRGAELAELAQALKDHQTRAVDVVAPASAIRMSAGHVVVQGVEPTMDANGVTEVNGLYKPTRVGLEGMATRLEIGTKYMRRCASDNVPALDFNVNTWMEHETFGERKLREYCGNRRTSAWSSRMPPICAGTVASIAATKAASQSAL